MNQGLTTENSVASSQLLDVLDTLGVLFLRGGSGARRTLAPDALLAALASSPEARIRLALIPLLLAHPEFAQDVHKALQSLSPDAAVILRCYYTAAYCLQEKYRNRLASVCGVQQALPDLFGAEFGLAAQCAPDNALRTLALHQQKLTGREINWIGTYEHAAQSWLRFMEYENRWQQFHPTISTFS